MVATLAIAIRAALGRRATLVAPAMINPDTREADASPAPAACAEAESTTGNGAATGLPTGAWEGGGLIGCPGVGSGGGGAGPVRGMDRVLSETSGKDCRTAVELIT